MKESKAFTLVELLAVIVILVLIAGVSFTTMNSILKNCESNQKEEAINNIVLASKAYNANNNGDLLAVPVSKLISDGYLNENQVEYGNSHSLNGCIRVNNGEYQYNDSGCEATYDYLETSEKCFSIGLDERYTDQYAINDYYDNENNDESQPKCPRNVVIPSIINNKKIISIGEDAFMSKNLSSVVIPDSVIKINHAAFANNRLVSVKMTDNVLSIENEAFRDNLLTHIEIPKKITYINPAVFNSNRLKKLEIPNGVIAIDSASFTNNELTSLTIPNSVKNIANNAFTNNHLSLVTIPNSVIGMDSDVFSGNSGIVLNIDNFPGAIENHAPWGATTVNYLR